MDDSYLDFEDCAYEYEADFRYAGSAASAGAGGGCSSPSMEIVKEQYMRFIQEKMIGREEFSDEEEVDNRLNRLGQGHSSEVDLDDFDATGGVDGTERIESERKKEEIPPAEWLDSADSASSSDSFMDVEEGENDGNSGGGTAGTAGVKSAGSKSSATSGGKTGKSGTGSGQGNPVFKEGEQNSVAPLTPASSKISNMTPHTINSSKSKVSGFSGIKWGNKGDKTENNDSRW